MEYYKSEKISNHVIRIIDFLGDCCYLVIGEKRAVLLDTLNGFGNIKEFAATFTDKEIFVLLSHGHIDHGSGACFFNEVYLNKNDHDLFYVHCSTQGRLKNYTQREITKNIPIKDFNPLYEGKLIEINPLQEFDLGNLTIKMVPVYGHTKGMMVPIIKEERMAVFGDACGVGVLLIGEQSTTVSEYKASLLALKTHEDEYDTILRNHGTFTSPKELLSNVIACCDKILMGKACGKTITLFNKTFYIAEDIDELGNRLDGMQGNIKYMEVNAK